MDPCGSYDLDPQGGYTLDQSSAWHSEVLPLVMVAQQSNVLLLAMALWPSMVKQALRGAALPMVLCSLTDTRCSDRDPSIS